MEERPCLIIFYAKFGEGHYQAAKALQEQFAQQGVTDVRLIDLFRESHPLLNAVSRFVYRKSMNGFPRLYGWTYRVTNGMRAEGPFGKWLHSLGMWRLKAIIAKERPDAVIHTFPFLAMYQLKASRGTDVPGYTVITDYVLHSRWVHPNTDGYFVATEALKADMMAHGVAADNIHVTGIPLRRASRSVEDRLGACRAFGLDPRKRYVMVMAGAGGLLSDLDALMPELLDLGEGFTFLLIAGRNAKLHRKLLARYRGHADIRVYGYVESLDRLMAVSSCIVTKAGGLTLSEALAMRLPAIVYRPLPGQEQGNAEYWAGRGAVRIARDREELLHALRDWSGLAPGNGGEAWINGLAARDIVQEILRGMQGQRFAVRGDKPQQGRRIVHDAT